MEAAPSRLPNWLQCQFYHSIRRCASSDLLQRVTINRLRLREA
jgi:hypothetical protein